MNLEVLSFGESLSLCRSAALLVRGRFRWLAQRADSGDPKLSQLFMDMAGEMERNLLEIQGLEGKDELPDALEETSGEQVARGFLPSLSKSVGGGRLDREAGFYLVECVLTDLAGFYGALVRQTCVDQSRELLLRSKQIVDARLQYLHHVVL